MKQYLLPVFADSLFRSISRLFGLKPGEWWDQPPMNYPHALISYVHWKNPFRFPKDAYIFADSGGFALISKTMADKDALKLDPVDVLRWQESMCNVGCVVDLPVRGTAQRAWEHGLRTTIAYTRRALPVYLKMREAGTSFRWWGVLHGNNEAEVREYHKALSQVYPFTDEGEGWAIRPEPQVNIYGVARSLRILNHLGIKRAHFLQATSQDVIAVLLVFGPQAGLEVVTFDSTSAIKFGANRKLWQPVENGLTFTGLVEQGESRVGRDWVLNVCPCAVCAHMRVRFAENPMLCAALDAKKCGGPPLMWFQLHNLHIQQRATATQAAMAVNAPKLLMETVLGHSDHGKVLRIFEEDGHEPGSIVPTGGTTSLLDLLR